ncbi:MAG: hypothetical protein D6815_04035, partial [Candidatus Dadabacteria bacterium]
MRPATSAVADDPKQAAVSGSVATMPGMAVVGRDDADAWRRFERYVARATDYERQRVRGRVRFDLVTMRALMDALGHPERLLVVAHVAGSNGKGSVCTLLDSI